MMNFIFKCVFIFPVILQIQHFYKFDRFSNQSWLSFMIIFGLMGLYFFRDKNEKPIQNLSDNDEYVSWSDMWDSYEYEKKPISDIFFWLLNILIPVFLIFGYYQNQFVYLWTKYAIIFIEVVSIFFLLIIPTRVIIKIFEQQKYLNIFSILSSSLGRVLISLYTK